MFEFTHMIFPKTTKQRKREKEKKKKGRNILQPFHIERFEHEGGNATKKEYNSLVIKYIFSK